MNTALAELSVDIDNTVSSSGEALPQSSFTSLSTITDGDLLILATPPPAHSLLVPSVHSSLPSLSASSLPLSPAASSLAILHTNIMNERIRSIFIEAFARCMGMDGSVMAVSGALALIDASPVSSSSAAMVSPSLPPISLLELIEQETLSITTAAPQARVASLASKIVAAASAASSQSLLTTNNNTGVVVKHFIGDVTYSLADIIECNRMTLSASTQALVASSSNSIVRSCLEGTLSQVKHCFLKSTFLLYFVVRETDIVVFSAN